MRVAIYLRKSRAEEFNDPVQETLKRHREMLLEYAYEHSFVVDESDIYEEVVSGERLYERPKMLELLLEVEKGRYDGVLCVDIDRLGRGAMSEQGVILETFKKSSTQIITLRKTYNLANELDEEYTEFETFMARRELKMIKRRMRRGVERTVQEGGFLAVPPFGYIADTIGKRPTLKINEDEAKYVRMMFDLYVNKGKGCQYIADTLNDLGVRPHRSEKFCRTSVRHILKNPVFIGKIVWNKKRVIEGGLTAQGKKKTVYRPPDEWTVVDGLHSPIIDEETFLKAQKIFEGRYRPPSYDGNIKNPLAGVLRCGRCGELLQRKPLQNGKSAILLCPTKGCSTSTDIDMVEDGLLELIKPEMENILIANFTKSDDNQTDSLLEKEIQNTKKKLLDRYHTLYELLESGVYTSEVFLERKKELDKKISGLEKLQPEIKGNDSKETCNNKTLFDYYKGASAAAKNKILKAFIKEGVYYKERKWGAQRFILHITINESICMLYGEKASSCSPHES